jgi:uncharacterized protein (DUF305 family)
MRARRPLALAGTGLALVLTLTACGSSSDHSSMSGMSGASSGATSAAGASSTGTSAGAATDIAFAQLMIPHHQQAVEMADMALSKASSSEVKGLAKQIKAAQDPEIAQMRAWLSAWGAPEQMPSASAGSMDHSGMDMGGMTGAGMMSAANMQKLQAATGAAFDRMWLQMMIAHHQGAITMANQVLDSSKNDQVKKLAQAIVSGQNDEISTMQKLLAA